MILSGQNGCVPYRSSHALSSECVGLVTPIRRLSELPRPSVCSPLIVRRSSRRARPHHLTIPHAIDGQRHLCRIRAHVALITVPVGAYMSRFPTSFRAAIVHCVKCCQKQLLGEQRNAIDLQTIHVFTNWLTHPVPPHRKARTAQL